MALENNGVSHGRRMRIQLTGVKAEIDQWLRTLVGLEGGVDIGYLIAGARRCNDGIDALDCRIEDGV